MPTQTVKDLEANCPNKKKHTKGQPEGYLEWQDWAAKKDLTHKQIKCDGCGLFVIWVKRRQNG